MVYALQGGGNAKRNINVVKVFITKKVRSNGGSVLAPYQISRGTLPSIAYEKGAGDVLVTNLSLGSLVIDAETVVGELAEAIVANNAEWETGDQLTFFYGRQSVDAVTETPRAVIVGTKVVLDVADSTPLWEITGSLGFSSVAVTGGYVLGMNRSIVDGAAAWIHSRESQGGETQFTESTQVSMSGPAGASIFYTVDGSTPTDQSLEYEEPITLSATTTVKAIAIKDGVSSSVTTRTYTKVEAGGGGEDEPGGDDH